MLLKDRNKMKYCCRDFKLAMKCYAFEKFPTSTSFWLHLQQWDKKFKYMWRMEMIVAYCPFCGKYIFKRPKSGK